MFTEIKIAGNGIEEAGHNFTVEKRPVEYQTGLMTGRGVAEGHYVNVRTDTQQAIGIVGERYEMHQPKDTWDFINTFVEISGGKVDRSLMLDNGATIGASISLKDVEYFKGDRITNGFVIIDSFDGSRSLTGKGLSQRWVCMNQLPHATNFFNIKHTKSIIDRMRVAKHMLNHFEDGMNNFDEKMRFLASASMGTVQAIEWFKAQFKMPKDEEGRARTIYDNRITAYKNLLENGKGISSFPQIRGTKYWALQAFTEYVNHHRSVRTHKGESESDKRSMGAVLGSGNTLMQKGFENILIAA